MTGHALNILGKLLEKKANRSTRMTELLRDPECEGAHGWYMYLPPGFNEALDIRLTERVKNGQKYLIWTQGSEFAFKQGDTIYDTPEAYTRWGEALQNIERCIQVKAASETSVSFTISTPNPGRTGLVKQETHTLTQSDFVQFLITGLPPCGAQ